MAATRVSDTYDLVDDVHDLFGIICEHCARFRMVDGKPTNRDYCDCMDNAYKYGWCMNWTRKDGEDR